jgi:hypothetical protein
LLQLFHLETNLPHRRRHVVRRQPAGKDDQAEGGCLPRQVLEPRLEKA